MKALKLIFLLTILLANLAFCKVGTPLAKDKTIPTKVTILPGADRPDAYLPLLRGKKVGLVVNQTSILTQRENIHLVDFLLKEGIKVQKVFVPEHGFRGDADAGELVKSDTDKNTGLPLVSLYGDH